MLHVQCCVCVILPITYTVYPPPCSVDEVGQRVAALSPRLEVASSTVSEAQAVVAMETSLEELEEWLVSCGKFSNNQLILVQIEEHKVRERPFFFTIIIHSTHV